MEIIKLKSEIKIKEPDGFFAVDVNGKKCRLHYYNKKIQYLVIDATSNKRKKDACRCMIWEDGAIRYVGNESWQNSDVFYNPEFPQKEVPDDIRLEKKDYDLIMEYLTHSYIVGHNPLRIKIQKG